MAIISILIAREDSIYTPQIDLRPWNNMLTQDSLYDESWLLTYEAESYEWLENQNGLKIIDEEPYFSQLKRHEVSFLNLERAISPIDEDELIAETDMEKEFIRNFRMRYGG